MAQKYLVFILAVGLMLSVSSCTSGGSKEADGTQQAQNDGAFSQEGEGDFAKQQEGGPQSQLQQDGQSGGASKTAEAGAPPQDGGQDLALDGQQSAPAGGSKAAAADKVDKKDDLSLDDPQPLPDGIAGQDPATAQPPAPPSDQPSMDNKMAGNTPPTDDKIFGADAAGSGAPSAAPAPEVAATNAGGDAAAGMVAPPVDAPATPKVFAPLQKVKEAAFDKDGTNLNRYYIARSDDKSVKAISKKLFNGEDKSKQLKAWNPTIAKRAPKAGDKIYYPSSVNPADTQMLSYYEEAGVPARTYTSQDGDNLRKLAKNWLGGSDSWKEVWETNPGVESKGDIPAGLMIKYWPKDVAAAPAANPAGPDVAKNMPPETGGGAVPPPPAPEAAPPMPPVAEVPPPPPGGGAVSPSPASTPDMAPPPGQQAGVNPPPPPPPPDQAAPPPPPPPSQASTEPPKKKVAPAKDSGDDDMMMFGGIGVVCAVAVAAIVLIVRKNRARSIDLSQTQV
jgi:hypothetical protein